MTDILIHFVDSELKGGEVYIAPSVKAIPVFAEFLTYERFGLPWLEVFVFAYHPRSCINPLLDEEVRVKQAYELQRQRTKNRLTGTPSYRNNERWAALRDYWNEHFVDIEAQRVLMLKAKIIDIDTAIANTSVRQEMGQNDLLDLNKKKGKKAIESDGNFVVDQSDVLKGLLTLSDLVHKQYAAAVAEMRRSEQARPTSSKAPLYQTAGDSNDYGL